MSPGYFTQRFKVISVLVQVVPYVGFFPFIIGLIQVFRFFYSADIPGILQNMLPPQVFWRFTFFFVYCVIKLHSPCKFILMHTTNHNRSLLLFLYRLSRASSRESISQTSCQDQTSSWQAPQTSARSGAPQKETSGVLRQYWILLWLSRRN